jgi:hypothetical protein
MGQFSNQPDFGTAVETITTFPATPSKPSAIYMGIAVSPALSITITVLCVDGTEVTFTGINGGSFLPVIVKKIVSAVNIQPVDTLFIR